MKQEPAIESYSLAEYLVAFNYGNISWMWPWECDGCNLIPKILYQSVSLKASNKMLTAGRKCFAYAPDLTDSAVEKAIDWKKVSVPLFLRRIRLNGGIKMKSKRNRIAINLLLSGLIFPFMLFGCGAKPEQAREILAKQNIPYTLEACAEHIKDDDVSIVKLFLEAGMETNTPLLIDGEEMLPLSYAAATNAIDVVKLLIKKGANINAKTGTIGATPLTIAVRHNSYETAELLINRGADINGKEDNGITALMIASMFNYVDIAKLLIKKGADINLQTETGGSAIGVAARENSLAIAKLLIEKGVDANAPNVLLTAVLNNFVDMAKLLIEGGADINKAHQVKEISGVTVLMVAAMFNYVDMVKLLINSGGDVNAKGDRGVTAISLTKSSEIVELLKRAGAKSEGDSKAYSKQKDSETQEEKLERVLGGIRLMPEVSWFEIVRNDVYVGFKKFPNDINQLIRAWALQGNRAINFGVHLWAVENVPSGWRPGQSGNYITVTARYGKIE